MVKGLSNKYFGKQTASRKRSRTLLLACVMCFILSLCGALVFLNLRHSPGGASPNLRVVAEPQEIKLVEVLVPRVSIEPGSQIQAEDFRKEARAQLALPQRVVKDYEELKNQYARSLILPGQPLQREYLTSVKPTNLITANIPMGYRAITISVDARSSVEGWVRPGARVDISWTANIRGQPALTMIVQNAKVLSAERQVDPKIPAGAPVPSTVTLLVTVADAAKIQLAATSGSLSLSLRGDSDIGKGSGVGSITTGDLLGLLTAQKAPEGARVKVQDNKGQSREYEFKEGKLVQLDSEH